jgi:hypothetical protein
MLIVKNVKKEKMKRYSMRACPLCALFRDLVCMILMIRDIQETGNKETYA